VLDGDLLSNEASSRKSLVGVRYRQMVSRDARVLTNRVHFYKITR